MIFKGLKIEKSYQKINEQYQHVWIGEFNIESPDGHRLMLKITPELCHKLIAVCADHIVEVAEEAASTMRATVIDQLTTLMITESKDDNK